ncbi:MAG: hypothetical protein KF722_06890 [Nitrospira sp.]|nr:hypothetical protein [Nitrospira sp.]
MAKQKMIVCRTKATYRLYDETWAVNSSDALKWVASVWRRIDLASESAAGSSLDVFSS